MFFATLRIVYRYVNELVTLKGNIEFKGDKDIL